jgi:hypothetical protein
MRNRIRLITDLSKGIIGAPDSELLWEEIIAQIPDEVLLKKDVRILNVACGHGTEARILVNRMIKLGRSKEDINNAIALLDKYNVFTNEVRKRYGFKNVITADFFAWVSDATNMKNFDIIIGNPPFQAPKNGDYSYWARFIQKAVSITNKDGYIAMIVPQGWLSPTSDIREGRLSILRDYFHKLDLRMVCLDSDRFADFKVGSSFSYFVLRNTVNQNGVARVVLSKTQTLSLDIRNLTFLPKGRINPFELQIRQRLQTSSKFNWIRQPVRGEDSIYSKNKNKYAVVNGNSRISEYWYSEEKPNNYDIPKVIVPYNGEFFKFIIDDGNLGYGNSSILKLNKNQINGARDYFSSKFVRWFLPSNGTEKYTQYNEPAYLNALPYIDLTKRWNDTTIYQFFGLSKNEIKYIESI